MPEGVLSHKETEMLEFMDSLEEAQAGLRDYSWQRETARKLREQSRKLDEDVARSLRRVSAQWR
ncbi:MAG: hypothetical protein LBK41_08435 [Clostridiales bacterium]|nr:hypothetical protein [Clostridiales bacterium]